MLDAHMSGKKFCSEFEDQRKDNICASVAFGSVRQSCYFVLKLEGKMGSIFKYWVIAIFRFSGFSEAVCTTWEVIMAADIKYSSTWTWDCYRLGVTFISLGLGLWPWALEPVLGSGTFVSLSGSLRPFFGDVNKRARKHSQQDSGRRRFTNTPALHIDCTPNLQASGSRSTSETVLGFNPKLKLFV